MDRRSRWLKYLTHDLNNTLASARLLGELLVDDATPEAKADLLDLLEAIDLATAQVDSAAAHGSLGELEEEMTWFGLDLADLLHEVVRRKALSRAVDLRLPDKIRISGDARALERAFTDMLINARKVAGTAPTVLVTATQTAHDVTIVIHHPGATIPPALRQELLEPFGAVLMRDRRLPVAACGLAYAHRVIQQHDGTIKLEDAPDGLNLVIRLGRPFAR